MKEGLSIGGVWVIYQVAKKLGIVASLGGGRNGQLALWQIFARVLEQGSRLSAVRLGTTYAMASVLSPKKDKKIFTSSFMNGLFKITG